MQFFYDLRLGYLVETPGIETPLGDLSAKAGDIESLVLQFGRSEAADNSNSLYAAGTWTPENLVGGSVIKIGIKEDGKYSDGDILAINAAWTQDTDAYLYLGEFNLNTTAINTALARLDADSENDVSSLACQLELTFQVGGTGGWRSSVRPVEVEIYHDIIGGSEGTPVNADDPDQYLLKADAASTSDGYGASLIGIEDDAANFTGTTVEAALAELAAGGGSGGTVTSVAVTGSDGIEVDSGSPITTSGTIAIGVNASNLKSHLSLDDVENTALSTWEGSGNITTLGTISTGTVPVANVSGLGTLATQNGTFSGTSSGTNTGDNAINSLYSGLVSNATHTGDVTGSTALTIANGAVTEAKCNSSINASLDLADSSIQPGNAALTDERVPTAAGLTSKFGTNKATIADGDKFTMLDSAASDAPKHSLFSLIKSTLKTYFDTLYNLYTLPVATTTVIGGVKRNPGDPGQYITGFDSSGNAMYGEPTSGYRPGRNYLINGDFLVSQRNNKTDLSDGEYTVADRFYCLYANDKPKIIETVSGSLLSPAEPSRSRVLKVEGPNTSIAKFGVVQTIEALNCFDLVNETVTLSFYADEFGPSSIQFKAAVIAWSGSADAMPKDFVSSWNSTGTNPTLVANCTYENTPVSLAMGSGFNFHQIQAVVDTSGAKNVALFIWAETSLGSASPYGFFLDRLQLEIGSTATPFERVPIADQLARCQRYYEVLRYDDSGSAVLSFFRTTNVYNHLWYYKVAKRVKPTIGTTLVSGSWGAGLVPNINAGIDCASLFRTTSFNASGTSGNIALAADAELGV